MGGTGGWYLQKLSAHYTWQFNTISLISISHREPSIVKTGHSKGLDIFIDRVALAKQEDNAFGSVRLSIRVCLSVWVSDKSGGQQKN